MTKQNGIEPDDFAQIERIVAERRAKFVELADSIWNFAELGFQETQSSSAQQAVMRSEGFRITSGLGGLPTAFLAERGSGGPIIGILGEFDALAELSQVAGLDREEPLRAGASGHGCGHNLLGTGSALAAVAVAEVIDKLSLPGTVRYYGCPAEEGGGGKAFMARAGVFDDLDAAFSWHPAAGSWAHMNRTNAFQQVSVKFAGKASHAALSPHIGRSALDAAELMSAGVNYLREHMLDSERIHYAYRNAGGTAANVVQARTEVAYIVRSPTIEGLAALSKRVERVAQGAAMMTDTTVEYAVESGMSPYQPNLVLTKMINDQLMAFGPPDFDEEDFKEAARFIQDSNARVNGALNAEIKPMSEAVGFSLGSTDVGDVSVVTPMAQIWMTSYAWETAFHSWQMVAQGKSSFAHKGMLQAAKVLAAAVIDAMRRPDLLARARAEHEARFGDGGYECPMPETVLPPI